LGDRRRTRDEILTQLEKTVREHMPRPRPDLELPLFLTREDRLLGIFEAQGAAIFEFDGAGHLTYASPYAESLLGFSASEFLTADCIEFHPEDLLKVVESGRHVRETGGLARNEVRMRHKRGHWLWVESALAGWQAPDDGGFHTVAIVRDITDLERALAARREIEARYRVVSQMSCDLIFEADAAGRPTYVSPGSEEIIGYTPDQMLAFEPFELLHPDDVERIRDQLEAEFVNNADETLGEVGRSRNRRSMEFRARHRDGRWVWFEAHGLTYVRANGDIRYLGVARDVTEQRNSERVRRELEESMQQAQKLESLGVLAGGIAHDFNNLLTPILGAAGLGLRELPADSPLREYFRKIQAAAARAAALTNQMLAYAGQRTLRVERLDLSTLVAEMQELLAASGSGKTPFDLYLAGDLPAVEGEAAQISQVIMNLVTNAVESLRDGTGRIAIRTGTVIVEAPLSTALFAESMTTGRHVYFEVADAGCGMEAETCARIFEPFFTTKFTGRGLGLAAVAGIVRAHRGAIEVESEPGRGTRFRILFPAAVGPATSSSALRPVASDHRFSSGTVLVIDDDEGVRDLAEAVLRRAGLTVLTAAGGHEGLKLFGSHADSIGVVLLDRTMPELSGIDTFQAIRALRPDARVVLVSGYAEERLTTELAGTGLAGFLKKPFLPESLLARVREVLEP
jgi:PAS domain S-box-containing protein